MAGKKTIWLLLLLPFVQSKAQNLVPNPSFELYKLCPTVDNIFNIGQPFNDLQKFCANWESVGIQQILWIGGGGQYLNACANIDIDYCGVPQSIFAYQQAHTGVGMAQIAHTYAGFRQYRMFQGVKLIAPLKIGHTYIVRFYASLADSSQAAMNNLGITFFTQKTKIADSSTISSIIYPNWAHVYSKEVIDNKNEWVKIEDTLTADSAYEYLVVGNFFDYNKTTFKAVNNSTTTGLYYPAYLLDDFSVEETKKTIAPLNTLICKGDSVLLKALGSSTDFYWSFNKKDTLSNKENIQFKVDTSFTLFLISNWGIDSVFIQAISYPKKTLPTDTVLCKSYYIHINAFNSNNASYLWNTGDTTAKISIEKAGKYIVKTTTGSCHRTDTVLVSSCKPTLYAPNSFTPNNDNLNDVFLPVGVQVFNYQLQIYNRWGKLVFESNDINLGWDGIGYNSDVYFYNITYTDKENINSYKLSGNISLLN